MCGGHLGVKRTMDQVRRRAFWIGWRRDVETFCRRCTNCCTYFRGKLPLISPATADAYRRTIRKTSRGPNWTTRPITSWVSIYCYVWIHLPSGPRPSLHRIRRLQLLPHLDGASFLQTWCATGNRL